MKRLLRKKKREEKKNIRGAGKTRRKSVCPTSHGCTARPRVGVRARRIPEAIASLLSPLQVKTAAEKEEEERPRRARTGEKLSGSSNLYSAALLSGKRRSGYKQCDAPPILSWNHGTHTDTYIYIYTYRHTRAHTYIQHRGGTMKERRKGRHT